MKALTDDQDALAAARRLLEENENIFDPTYDVADIDLVARAYERAVERERILGHALEALASAWIGVTPEWRHHPAFTSALDALNQFVAAGGNLREGSAPQHPTAPERCSGG